MAARRACLECGAKKGIRVVTLYNDTDPEVFTSSKVHYCPTCLEKLELICPEHNALKIPVLRVSSSEEGDGREIEEYSIITADACTFCAQDDILAIPAEEQDRILALVNRLEDVSANVLDFVAHVSRGVLRGMRPEEGTLFSLALAARFEKLSLNDFIFELFRQQSFGSEVRQ